MEEDIADPDNEPSGQHSNKFKWPPVAVSFLSSFNFLYQVLILLLGWSHIVIALYVTLLFPSVYKYSDLAFTVTLVVANLFLGTGLVVATVSDCLLIIQAFRFGLKMSTPLVSTLMIYNLLMSLFPTSFLSSPFLALAARANMDSEPDLKKAFIGFCHQAACFCLFTLFYYSFLYFLLSKNQKTIEQVVEAERRVNEEKEDIV